MLELTQNENNLIGSSAAIRALAEKDHARILVISDSHGNFRIMEKIFKQYGPGCDGFIFCGDGARDIAEILELANEDESFREVLPSVFAIVRGNGDPEIYPVSYEIGKDNPAAREYPKGSVLIPYDQTLTVNGHKFFICHGHYQGVDYGRNDLTFEAGGYGCNTAFYGHTHVARQEILRNCTCINPGSCSRPRGGQSASFAIVTVEKTFIDTAFIKADGFRIWQPLG